MTCADCCELVTGAGGPIAYCHGCLAEGAPRAHRRRLWRLTVALTAVILVGLFAAGAARSCVRGAQAAPVCMQMH